MTRGTGILLTLSNVFATSEFNGDMYPEHHGRTFFNDLRCVTNKEEMEQLQKYWATIFDYKQKNVVDVTSEVDMYHSELSLHPYEWFSDWLYVVNQSGVDFLVKARDRDVSIPDGAGFAFNFGKVPTPKDMKILRIYL